MRTFPMRLGWVQACSPFMWELCNRPTRMAGEQARHPCARRTGDDGPAYVQLRHLGVFTEALVLAWGPGSEPVQAYLPAAMALAQRLPVDALSVVLPETDAAGIEDDGQLVGKETLWELALTPQ